MENQALIWISVIGSLLGLSLVAAQNKKQQRSKVPVKTKPSKKR